jgi:fructose-1,6-bisphosphatase I/sedoheptulose-1,7-bisphosphatase/fructose-1,6-bisphosphatase I
MEGRITIHRFLVEEQRRARAATGELPAVLADLVPAFKAIAAAVGKGALAGVDGDAPSSNAGGERQKKLDLVANEHLLRACEASAHLAGMASEELEDVHACEARPAGGRYVLLVDPLDGSSNLDVDVSVGTIFSILRRRAVGPLDPAELLHGAEQVCAGYAIYGPSTMLVLTLGRGVHGFTLDREIGELVLTHPHLRIPEETREFAVNASNERFWEPPVRRYVSECLAGATGPRGADFNMRWIASLVAEVHRILIRGGVFMYPRDTKLPARAGRLRLLYEARPMAMIVEQAGGAASTGRERLLAVAPGELHERVPVILGSRAEVERLAGYHREHDENGQPFSDPLFNVRTLFRA